MADRNQESITADFFYFVHDLELLKGDSVAINCMENEMNNQQSMHLLYRITLEKSLQNQGKSVVKQTPKIMSMYSFPLTGIILIIGNLSEGLKSIL